MPTLPATLQYEFFKMENSLFTRHLNELFNLWNNTACQMNYWVHTTGRYRSTSILEKVHKAFFNYYQINAMTYMLDEIILARMMTALDLEFERALHYHGERYESYNDYGLPPQITRPICCNQYLHQRSPLTQLTPPQPSTQSHPSPRCPRSLPFREGVCWCLTFHKIPLPMPETYSEDDEEPLSTADLDDWVWDEDLVPDSREYLCIHEIPRLATPNPQPIPVTPPPQPNQGVPATLPQQPDQVEVSPQFELMELDIPEDIPDLLDVPKEVMSDFDAWALGVLSYQFLMV